MEHLHAAHERGNCCRAFSLALHSRLRIPEAGPTRIAAKELDEKNIDAELYPRDAASDDMWSALEQQHAVVPVDVVSAEEDVEAEGRRRARAAFIEHVRDFVLGRWLTSDEDVAMRRLEVKRDAAFHERERAHAAAERERAHAMAGRTLLAARRMDEAGVAAHEEDAASVMAWSPKEARHQARAAAVAHARCRVEEQAPAALNVVEKKRAAVAARRTAREAMQRVAMYKFRMAEVSRLTEYWH